MTAVVRRPLLVVALGGNALSPPHGDLSFATERLTIHRATTELADLACAGYRLLIVHGNGTQVGRLLAAENLGDPGSLDVHVAQTQGELGYLIGEGLDRHLGVNESAAVVTRVLVDRDDPAFAHPTKPVGAVLRQPDPNVACARTPDGRGWRRVVASPRPIAVVEEKVIGTLLRSVHVIAGGGGGIPLIDGHGARTPQSAVIDKDWVAALLAVAFTAEALVFVTDVAHACDRFGHPDQDAITRMSAAEARRRLADGVFAAGSMAPKVESAAQFVEATGRAAVITTIGAIAAAMRDTAGTTVRA
jgi:carbamate kinase